MLVKYRAGAGDPARMQDRPSQEQGYTPVGAHQEGVRVMMKVAFEREPMFMLRVIRGCNSWIPC